jgi:N-acetylmuramoyl-L-alanine amidase
MTMQVLLDIGHANHTGASGNGLEEHEVALSIGNALKELLEEAGYKTTLLDYPTLSNSQDLRQTAIAANRLTTYTDGGTIGISLHCDASDNAEAHGGHVCYHPFSTRGQLLATGIAQHMTVERPKLYILNATAAPWVLVECGFITNPNDAVIMSTNAKGIAQAIADGVADYVRSQS